MDRRILRHRILARVQKAANGCWLWTSSSTNGGYGTYRTMGLSTTAHRIAYIAWLGEIPSGLELDHKCKNTRCVNPAHLEPVTHLGHEFTPENTRIKNNGCRACVACQNRRNAVNNRRRREESRP